MNIKIECDTDKAGDRRDAITLLQSPDLVATLLDIDSHIKAIGSIGAKEFSTLINTHGIKLESFRN